MTSQHHESMKSLISCLNITSYQGLLETALDETNGKQYRRSCETKKTG
jgi:hypothetical protein